MAHILSAWFLGATKKLNERTPGCIHRFFQENAGFKLLMKLGYKGGGLGKDGAGAANPLMPELKQGRAGRVASLPSSEVGMYRRRCGVGVFVTQGVSFFIPGKRNVLGEEAVCGIIPLGE